MSETVLRILADELTVLRIICKHCNAVIEQPVAMLLEPKWDTKCPGCNAVLRHHRPGTIPDSFAALAAALRGLQGREDVAVEFILADKSAAPKT